MKFNLKILIFVKKNLKILTEKSLEEILMNSQQKIGKLI